MILNILIIEPALGQSEINCFSKYLLFSLLSEYNYFK